MSSAVGLAPANQGAPQVAAPQLQNYQIPGADQLMQQDDKLLQAPGLSPDTSGVQKTISDQNDLFTQLQAIANGTQPTLAEQQAKQNISSYQSQAQGAATSIRGVNPVAALQQEQTAEQAGTMQIQAQVARTAAQQRVSAMQQAGQLAGQITQEQLQVQEAQVAAQQANAQFRQMVLGQEFSISSSQQAARQAYNRDLATHQAEMRRESIAQNQAHQETVLHYVAGGLATVGAVVAGIFSFGTAAVPLGALAASQYAQGIQGSVNWNKAGKE